MPNSMVGKVKCHSFEAMYSLQGDMTDNLMGSLLITKVPKALLHSVPNLIGTPMNESMNKLTLKEAAIKTNVNRNGFAFCVFL